MELINRLAGFFREKLPEQLDATQICALSGLTCVSDWIGSGSYFDMGNGDPVTPDLVHEAVAAAGLSPDVRGETLTLQQFAAVADALAERM